MQIEIGKRKILGYLAAGGLLLVGFLAAGALNISEGLYIAFAGGVTGLFGVFVEGNVRAKKYTDGGTGQ